VVGRRQVLADDRKLGWAYTVELSLLDLSQAPETDLVKLWISTSHVEMPYTSQPIPTVGEWRQPLVHCPTNVSCSTLRLWTFGKSWEVFCTVGQPRSVLYLGAMLSILERGNRALGRRFACFLV
jgi:hypothetical protein